MPDLEVYMAFREMSLASPLNKRRALVISSNSEVSKKSGSSRFSGASTHVSPSHVSGYYYFPSRI